MTRHAQGTFTKWVNNDGTCFTDASEDRTLLEFMKFTYDFTGGYMLVRVLRSHAG